MRADVSYRLEQTLLRYTAFGVGHAGLVTRLASLAGLLASAALDPTGEHRVAISPDLKRTHYYAVPGRASGLPSVVQPFDSGLWVHMDEHTTAVGRFELYQEPLTIALERIRRAATQPGVRRSADVREIELCCWADDYGLGDCTALVLRFGGQLDRALAAIPLPGAGLARQLDIARSGFERLGVPGPERRLADALEQTAAGSLALRVVIDAKGIRQLGLLIADPEADILDGLIPPLAVAAPDGAGRPESLDWRTDPDGRTEIWVHHALTAGEV